MPGPSKDSQAEPARPRLLDRLREPIRRSITAAGRRKPAATGVSVSYISTASGAPRSWARPKSRHSSIFRRSRTECQPPRRTRRLRCCCSFTRGCSGQITLRDIELGPDVALSPWPSMNHDMRPKAGDARRHLRLWRMRPFRNAANAARAQGLIGRESVLDHPLHHDSSDLMQQEFPTVRSSALRTTRTPASSPERAQPRPLRGPGERQF